MTATAAPAQPQTLPAPVPAREPTNYEKFRNYVQTEDFLRQVGPLVGGENQAKTFVRVVLNAVQKTPELLYAERKSLLLACMAAARDRLMPDGKEAVLNIYRTKIKRDGRDEWIDAAQYLPMVAGLIKKLYESGHVTSVDAAVVYKADVFEFERGDNPRIVHKPNLEAEDPGPIIAAYVIIKLKTGETKREVLARRDIDKIRAASKAPDSPAWKVWFDQMAIKAVIKRAYKQVPSSVEVDAVIAADNDALGFDDFSAPDAFNTKPTAVDAINAEMKKPEPDKPAQITHEQANTIPAMKVEPTKAETKVETTGGNVETSGAHVDTTTGEVREPPKEQERERPSLSYAHVKKLLDEAMKAKSRDKLDEAASQIPLVVSPAQQAELNSFYRASVAALEADDGK